MPINFSSVPVKLKIVKYCKLTILNAMEGKFILNQSENNYAISSFDISRTTT